MNIPEKAVEAAAQELYAEQRSTSDGFDMWPEWEEAPEVGRGAFRDESRAVLKAAAPFIEAAVLHEQACTWGTTVDEYGRSIASHIHRDARVAEHGADAT